MSLPASHMTCSRCQTSHPWFVLSGGNELALSVGIAKRGNHFHLLGLWMDLEVEPVQPSGFSDSEETCPGLPTVALRSYADDALLP